MISRKLRKIAARVRVGKPGGSGWEHRLIRAGFRVWACDIYGAQVVKGFLRPVGSYEPRHHATVVEAFNPPALREAAREALRRAGRATAA